MPKTTNQPRRQRTPDTLAGIIHGALVQIGIERPSPDWDNDPAAARVLATLPQYARHLRLRPPVGTDPDDWIQDLRLTLVVRSHSMKSRWDPSRGKSSPASWAAQVMRSRSQNIHRDATRQRSHRADVPQGMYENFPA